MRKQSLNIRHTLRIYWSEIRKHKVSFFLMLFLIPIGSLAVDALLPYFLSQAIGGITDGDAEAVKQFLIIAGAVGLAGALFNYGGFQAMVIHESKVISGLRQSAFNQLINKDMSFFSNSKVGAMTSRYIDFVRAQVQIQDLFIIRTLGFLLSVGGGLAILASHSIPIALMVGGLIVLLILQIRWSMHIRRHWRHERKLLVNEIHGHVADALTNNLVVKTFAGEKQEMAALGKLTGRFSKIYRKDIGFTVKEGSLRVLLMVIVQIVSIVVAANMVLDGTLSVAVAVFVLAYMQRIGSQLFVLGEILNNFDQAFLDAEPMTNMLLKQNVVNDKPDAIDIDVITPSITFRSVSFRYEDATSNVVSDLNLEIAAGEKIGLVGHSGAGKTTVTQLLLRFHDPTEGKILVGGHEIDDMTQESLRHHIAYVPQEPLLFHRTLRENISYGRLDASEDDIYEAARKAHALEFMEELPHGLETLVGERGVKLSGGQRQRVAIARSILKDAPILVLDEATSALDSESEKLIQASLDDLMQNRTAIVIAHRLSTIQKMDRIVVMDNGRILEQGSHKELLAKKGAYAKLWAHQSGGFIEE